MLRKKNDAMLTISISPLELSLLKYKSERLKITMSTFIQMAIRENQIFIIEDLFEIIAVLKNIEDENQRIIESYNHALRGIPQRVKTVAYDMEKAKKQLLKVRKKIDTYKPKAPLAFPLGERTARFHLCFEMSEYDMLQEMCEKAGITTTAFIRCVIRSENIIILKGLSEMITLLSIIQNQYHRIIKTYSHNPLPEMEGDIRKITETLSQIEKELTGIIEKVDISQ